ncbi:MAG TPA: prepilin-type N-terminal cleavage/methylation domain-containing protein [Flavisolibacter sp.]|jgi:hypothetical protein
MKRNLNIKAFTIIELVIALLLSSVVIGVTYTAFALWKKQFTGYHNRSAETGGYVVLCKALQSDADRALYIEDSAGVLLFRRPGFPDVRYELSGSRLLRTEGESIDSFFVQVEGLEAGKLKKELPLVRSIGLKAVVENKPVYSLFIKQYAAKDLLNAERHE